jgi:hypothetical protein
MVKNKGNKVKTDNKEVKIGKFINKDSYEKLFKTYNYKQFIFITGNREIDRNNLIRVINLITEIGYQKIPIQVKVMEDGTLGVVDGQHRLEAIRIFEKGNFEDYGIKEKEIEGFKTKKLPIYYIILDNAPLSIIPQINGTKRWSISNFIKSHEATGNIHYKKLLTIQKMFPEIKNVRIFINIAKFNSSSGRFSSNGLAEHSIRKGTFTFDNFDEAVVICNQIMDYKICEKNFKNSPWGSYLFFASLIKIMKMPIYNHIEVMKKVERNYSYIIKQHTLKDYVMMMSNIVNHRSQQKIYFEQYL